MHVQVKRLLTIAELESGLKAKDVAEQLGMSEQQYSRLKNSKNKHLELLMRVKDICKLDWDAINNAIEGDYGKK